MRYLYLMLIVATSLTCLSCDPIMIFTEATTDDPRLQRVDKGFFKYKHLNIHLDVTYYMSSKRPLTQYSLQIENTSDDVVTLNTNCISMDSTSFYEPVHKRTNMAYGLERMRKVKGDSRLSIGKDEFYTLHISYKGGTTLKTNEFIEALADNAVHFSLHGITYNGQAVEPFPFRIVAED